MKYCDKQKNRYLLLIFSFTFFYFIFYQKSTLNAQGEIEYRRKRSRTQRKALPPSTSRRPSAPAPATLMAQITGIRGRVIDAAGAEPLPEATIQILQPETAVRGVLTDFAGEFTFEKLKPGLYTLKIEYVGYAPQIISDIKVEKNHLTPLNVGLKDESRALEAVVIESLMRTTSDAALLSVQRNSVQITDGVSSDMIMRETPDFQTAYILRRMPGVAFIEDRYLVIRGLFERYNLTTINGSPTPVSEYERYTFDFNGLPASLLKNVRMIKSTSADQFSDFAGGLINFQFQDIPEQSALRANVQFFYNNLTTGKDFFHYQGNRSVMGGLFTENRPVPDDFPNTQETLRNDVFSEANIAAAKSLTLNASPTIQTAGPAQNYNLVWQKRFRFAGNDAGFSAAFNFQNNVQNMNQTRRTPDTLSNDGTVPRLIDDYYTVFQSEKSQTLNFIFNAGIYLGKKGKLSWFNLLTNGRQQTATLQNGNYYYPEDSSYYDYHYYIQRYSTQRLYSTQLVFEHRPFAFLQLNARLFYNNSVREEPAQWGYGYEPYDSVQWRYSDYADYGAVRTFYGVENIIGGVASVSLLNKIKGIDKLEAGLMVSARKKTLDSRLLYIASAAFFGMETNLDSALLQEANAAQLFKPENRRADGLLMMDKTDSTNNYSALTQNYAPYLMGDFHIGRRFSVNMGLRLEVFYQRLTIAGVTTSQNYLLTERRYIDPLPSLNARYILSEKTNLRFSATQTLSRPDVKDLSLFKYFNYFNATRTIGNPNLQRARITNLDARIEFFPTGLEILSLSLFYKYFENPIIQTMRSSAESTSLDLQPSNTPAAQAAGVEIEIRRSLGNILNVERLRPLVAYANLALMRSTDGSGNFADLWKSGRQMQGLAPMVINAGIIYQEPITKISAALFYNRSGQRIAVVGTPISPDIYEMPRHILDVQVSRELGKHFELRLAMTDIFQQPLRWVQMYEGRTNFDPTRDREILANKRGFQFIIGLTAKF